MATSGGQSRQAVLTRAAQCADDGRIGEAERILKDALSDHPDDALLWFRLGNLYLELENFTRAIDAYHRALDADPDNPVVLNDLGYALDRTGDFNSAGDAYARAAASARPFPLALYNHALRLIDSNALDAAEAALCKALDAEPGLAPALLALGEISEKRGETEKASDYYRRALAYEPSNPDALLKTAYLEMNRCRFDAAVAGFEAFMKLAPANEHVRLSLAACLQEVGRTDEALDIYRQLLAEDRARYYSVIKNLMSSGRGVIWLRANELRSMLLPDEA